MRQEQPSNRPVCLRSTMRTIAVSVCTDSIFLSPSPSSTHSIRYCTDAYALLLAAENERTNESQSFYPPCRPKTNNVPTTTTNKMIFKGQDAWRNHQLFTRLWASPFPGFRNAVVIFGAYLAIETAIEQMSPKEPHGHGQHH